MTEENKDYLKRVLTAIAVNSNLPKLRLVDSITSFAITISKSAESLDITPKEASDIGAYAVDLNRRLLSG